MTTSPSESSWSVRAPSRLHFGFLSALETGARSFAGVGLMIQDPFIELTSGRSDDGSTESVTGGSAIADDLVTRVDRLRRALAHQWNLPIERLARIHIQQAPPQHVGLGVGTQLSLSVAALLSRSAGLPEASEAELAAWTGRGKRSSVGIHGWRQGGLLVEAGHLPGEPLAPLIVRQKFPEHWGILLVRPTNSVGRHGRDEDRLIHEQLTIPSQVRQRLSEIALFELVPSVVGEDLNAFRQSLTEFNRRVGECFAAMQGGTYAGPRVQRLAEEMIDRGWGAAQSSWGPTLFTVFESTEHARQAAEQLSVGGLIGPDDWRVTAADNHGARLAGEPHARETGHP